VNPSEDSLVKGDIGGSGLLHARDRAGYAPQTVPYHSIEDPVKLRRVLEATLLLEQDVELSALLRHIVEEARSMVGARYGALGVLNDDRTALAEFLTVGIEDDAEEMIGSRPTGQGVLGLLIVDSRPLRLADIGSHPDSFGFPPNHPPMTSFLGVPIKVRGEVYGNLYLTDKIGWSEFTGDDQALVEALALGAGIAIENARLHQRVAEAAVQEDRARLARDLHDTVIQRLFAVGLSLQSIAGSAAATGLTEVLDTAISDLDDTIRQIRSSIFELASTQPGVRASVLSLVQELKPVVGFEVQVTFDGPIDSTISDQIAEHLVATIREAVTNIARHSHASEARVMLSVADGLCRLQVSDDGTGVGKASKGEGGLGLANLRRRAEKLGGSLAIESPASGGTTIVWQVPVIQ
jgi:signal transduction histidine kinase